ncbi:short-chain dehydrogenase [Siminovitchia terrae]|uniref:Short-chain dehydrogenase n=1 Tax=Siminovitchia terrae TaxID=1914933 RepID=A0A429X6L1_SIMTE|nr:short-chain dehydrogenase [Siminovitchia terrae]RST59067.1 short-chain dehydrogenase [Siminovitchia terrae]GIN92299.1 short-chain dehydrogenase [Siminovitchia terrae]
MEHALVIGGTGMLSGATHWLVQQNYRVSVIARNWGRMKRLIDQSEKPSAITPVLVDYCNVTDLRSEIKRIIHENGEIKLVVAWIHSIGKNALPIIAEVISKNSKNKWRLFHVLGSSIDLKKTVRDVDIPSGCRYRQIQLGFVIENDHSRWLNHKEISHGIIDCIQKDAPLHIIGTVEPWNLRP